MELDFQIVENLISLSTSFQYFIFHSYQLYALRKSILLRISHIFDLNSKFDTLLYKRFSETFILVYSNIGNFVYIEFLYLR